MPNFRHITTVTAYRDRGSKGWSRGRQRFHDCWRVEIYVNGERIRRYRSHATTKAEAIAGFSDFRAPPGRCGTRDLSDRYVAAMLVGTRSTLPPEEKAALAAAYRQHPELMEVRRNQLLLNRFLTRRKRQVYG
ncbi:hypothetical protein [Hymenobacter cheonanensis]|uniref:hypothetical protein n=1 Tax=Hymenobacter sp. CA2-7 TaxID=3063993 RepID=UPI002712BDB0|nr:hypothetical protein [Hymenobacter sp. CA2-7]MDO7885326.1 hypothetical protein [Hymenobacter sp. CA2-7]